MQKRFAGLAFAVLLGLGACTTVDPDTGYRSPNRTGTGAIVGAVIGAAAGTAAGGDDGRNAAVGAVVGAIAGGAVGAYMDENERKLRERTAGTGIGVVREGNNIRLNMPSDVTFDVDRSNIKGEFVPILNDVAATLREYPKTVIDVVGHTDSTGSENYNQDLSERRALSVMSFLSENGVRSERIIASGSGELRPIADNASTSGRAKNRRVEILLRPITS